MRSHYYSVCLLAIAALGGLPALAKPLCTPEPGLAGRSDVIFSCSFEHPDWRRDWGLEQAPRTNETLDADPALKFEPFQGKALRARIPKGGNSGGGERVDLLKCLADPSIVSGCSTAPVMH